MRDCDFCKDRNIPPQAKQHADDKCTFASKEQIDALLKTRAERRKAKQERFDTKKRAKNSIARLAQSSIDDNEVAPACIFGGDRGALILRSRGATASGAMRTFCSPYKAALGCAAFSVPPRAGTSASQSWSILAMPSGAKKQGNYHNCPSSDLADARYNPISDSCTTGTEVRWFRCVDAPARRSEF